VVFLDEMMVLGVIVHILGLVQGLPYSKRWDRSFD